MQGAGAGATGAGRRDRRTVLRHAPSRPGPVLRGVAGTPNTHTHTHTHKRGHRSGLSYKLVFISCGAVTLELGGRRRTIVF